ncbi:MAG: murein transglycosylase [Planctomycetota bacterium]|nr:MAG: murein transglycosylase [Planctomycetota bacterium]
MIRRLLTGAACAALLACSGCFRPLPLRPPRPARPLPRPPQKDYQRPLPAGAWALRKLSPTDRKPNLRRALADRQGLLEALERSLAYLAKPSSRAFFPVSGIRHGHLVRSLEVFRDLLRAGKERSPEELAQEVERRFDFYRSVGCDGHGTVLFTGYYTPVFRASRTRTPRFRYPLHRPPEGHVKDPRTGETLGLRRADGSVDPHYPDRDALLSSGLLAGRELAWLEHAYEAYIVGVQGSAELELVDGGRLSVAYAGTNGRPYTSIGRALVADGLLRPEELNLRGLIRFFSAHPEAFRRYAARNQRYVFFQEGDGRPRGCLNEPVTPRRSIATDKQIFPRGGLCLVEADLPGSQGVRERLFLDQDAGGAIRAPGRCDVYMGVGEEAGALAGHTLVEGRLYYLLLSDDELYADAGW